MPVHVLSAVLKDVSTSLFSKFRSALGKNLLHMEADALYTIQNTVLIVL